MNVAKPVLHKEPLTYDELESWRTKGALVTSRNNSRLLKCIDKSLRGIMFFRGHLRMRVNFGTFVLGHYRISTNNQPAYSFEEFREMLLHEATSGHSPSAAGLDLAGTENWLTTALPFKYQSSTFKGTALALPCFTCVVTNKLTQGQIELSIRN